MIIGGVHAREWGSCEILITLAADVLGAISSRAPLTYGNRRVMAHELAWLATRVNLMVFPLVNPDGRKHSQSHAAAEMWRKNRRPAPLGAAGPQCVGVDINRNFEFLFDIVRSFDSAAPRPASTDPCDFETYQGPAAFSEPETQNVRWLLDSHPQVRWFVDVHSYLGAILHSWGDDESQSTDPGM